MSVQASGPDAAAVDRSYRSRGPSIGRITLVPSAWRPSAREVHDWSGAAYPGGAGRRHRGRPRNFGAVMGEAGVPAWAGTIRTRAPSSLRERAAVDDDLAAAQIRGIVRGQEQDHRHHLVHRTHASE